MFDIGFLELILVSIVGLLVLGPERLPGAIRTVSLYVGKLRRSFSGLRAEIERELKADEIRQELHNQSILQDLRQTEQELRKGLGVDNPLADGDAFQAGDDQSGDKPAADSSSATASGPGETDARPGESPDADPDATHDNKPATQSAKP